MGYLIILIVLALIALLLFVPITFEYTLFYDGNFKSKFLIRFLFYKNDLSKKTVKEKKKPKKEKKKISEIIEDVKYYKKLYGVVKSDIANILKFAKEKAIKIKRVGIDISFAGKDAMQTGIYTGVLNGAVYNAVSVVQNSVGMEEWSVNIEPDFHKDAFVDTKIHCILNTKIAHIIVVLIKFLRIYKKHKLMRKNIK